MTSFFLDTNILVYRLTGSPYGEPCARILDAVVDGRADGRTSTAVLEELWHLELRGIQGLDGATRDAYGFLGPLLAVDHEVFGAALDVETPVLGANDRIHVATCLANGIRTIVTADAGFDGVEGLARVDPLDDAGVDRLIEGSSPPEGDDPS